MVQAVQHWRNTLWPRTRTAEDIVQFESEMQFLTSYYREIVKSCASIEVPLYKLGRAKKIPFV